ncbi:phage holin family protein [Planktothrix mougeotii]|uniref:Phage holin family protein n=1 Tax=Planktothrix mougeotii LEGE 06226 TaxID=1828728 RepID=A0ABR9U7M3_9CYAN|nr:phage holin family protein [Planktothrix mougeotii]MBE9142461.1 phage holin family protein [Planktothrix mougeotii LEGE 06226]
MLNFFLTWLISAISLGITAYIVPGFTISSWQAAAVGVVVMALVNAIIKPIITIFTLPLTILTLGLFLFVVNAISISLVAYFTPGFSISSFWAALLGSIVLSLVSSLFNQILGKSNNQLD